MTNTTAKTIGYVGHQRQGVCKQSNAAPMETRPNNNELCQFHLEQVVYIISQYQSMGNSCLSIL